MQIESTRFGSIEIQDEAVLTFPEGLIGLPGTRYALIGDGESSVFYWLHSVEHCELAVPVTSPWLFRPDYEARVPDSDAEALELEGPEVASIFCVVRAAATAEECTMNLLAPLVVHAARRVGRQVINEAAGYGVREPLFSEVELEHVEPTGPGVPVAGWAG